MKTSSRRLDVQGLRAFAVIVVVLDHMLHWPTGGFAGVDMFFVISGFLITGLLIREYHVSHTISFSRFYLARVKRILPAALLVLIVTIVAAYLLLGNVRANSVARDGVWAALFGANWNFLIQGTDYFQQDAAVSPLQHFWSLSVEEQFYFVWPWLLLGLLVIASRLLRRSVRAETIAGVALSVIIGASFVWAMYSSVTSPTSAYFSTFTRAWELGVGALLAVCAPLLSHMGAWLRTVLSYVGLALMVASVFVIDAATTWPAPWAALPVVGTALVLVSGIGGEARGNVLLTNPLSVYIGDISYSLYLWHFPVIVFSMVLFPEMAWYGYIAVFAVSIALSIAAYHLVEYPLHRSPLWMPPAKRRTWGEWRRSTVPGLAKGAAAFVCAGLIVGASLVIGGTERGAQAVAAPERDGSVSDAKYALTSAIVDGLNAEEWPGDMEAQIENRAAWDPEVQACSDPSTYSGDGCSFGTGDRTLLVVGDSLARAYVPAYKEILDLDEWTIVQMTLNGCEFNTTTYASERSVSLCDDHVRAAIAASDRLEPDAVVVTSQWATHRVYGKEAAVGFDEWWPGAREALEGLSGHVVYVAPPPYEKAIDSCYSAVASPRDCISELTDSWKSSDEAFREFSASAEDVDYVSSLDWFCYEERCPSFVDGKLTRSDNVHPGQPYLQRIVDVMAEDLSDVLNLKKAES